MTLLVSMICLSACGKADDTEPVVSSAIETDDQQEPEEENIIEEEPETEVMEVTAVEGDIEDQLTETTNEAGNGAGEQITTQEEDYFKEAEELWEIHSDELSCNWETFREAYSTERANGSSKDEALETMLDLFKKQEQPKQQQQPKEQTSSQSSTTNSNQSGSTPPLTPEQQAIAEQMGGASYLDTSTATNGFGVSGTVDWGNITAE